MDPLEAAVWAVLLSSVRVQLSERSAVQSDAAVAVSGQRSRGSGETKSQTKKEKSEQTKKSGPGIRSTQGATTGINILNEHRWLDAILCPAFFRIVFVAHCASHPIPFLCCRCCSPVHRTRPNSTDRWFGHEAGRLCPVGSAGLCDDGSSRSVTSTHTEGEQWSEQGSDEKQPPWRSHRDKCLRGALHQCSALQRVATRKYLSYLLQRWGAVRRCDRHRVADRRPFIPLRSTRRPNRSAARPVHRGVE